MRMRQQQQQVQQQQQHTNTITDNNNHINTVRSYLLAWQPTRISKTFDARLICVRSYATWLYIFLPAACISCSP
eukprot:240159-Pyramimonas_sp.AAC.1